MGTNAHWRGERRRQTKEHALRSKVMCERFPPIPPVFLDCPLRLLGYPITVGRLLQAGSIREIREGFMGRVGGRILQQPSLDPRCHLG